MEVDSLLLQVALFSTKLLITFTLWTRMLKFDSFLPQHALLAVVTVCFCCATKGSLVGTEADTENVLRNVLAAISGGLKFLDSEHQRLNLDAVIGTRLVEGN